MGGSTSRVGNAQTNGVFGTHWATRIFVPPSRQNRSIRHPTGKYQWASGRIFCTPSSPVHMTFTFMAKKTCQNRVFSYNNPRTVYFSALLLCMQKNRRKFYNNSATQNGASACVYFQRQRRWFSARDVRVTMQITSQFQYFA